jgi:hypothetical protein
MVSVTMAIRLRHKRLSVGALAPNYDAPQQGGGFWQLDEAMGCQMNIKAGN